SGGNIAILAGLLLAAFRFAGCLGRTAMLSAAATLVAYAALVGGGPSVDRATLMAVLYFLARAFDHRGVPLNGLAAAAALLVAAHPLSFLDPAFLLTIGATLAILVVVPIASVGAEDTYAPASLGDGKHGVAAVDESFRLGLRHVSRSRLMAAAWRAFLAASG